MRRTSFRDYGCVDVLQVNFDLDLGPAVDGIYPHCPLSAHEKETMYGCLTRTFVSTLKYSHADASRHFLIHPCTRKEQRPFLSEYENALLHKQRLTGMAKRSEFASLKTVLYMGFPISLGEKTKPLCVVMIK